MNVLFDVDGVLVEPFLFRAHLSAEHGIDPRETRPFFDSRFNLCARGEADLLEELPALFALVGWHGEPQRFLDLWFSTENAPIESTFRFVAELQTRGVSCHVASNQERHRARYLADVMGFADQFDRLFFSCDLGVQKPHAEYFAQIESALGCDPSHLVFVDDHAPNVTAAAARGWNAVLYRGEGSLAEVDQVLAT